MISPAPKEGNPQETILTSTTKEEKHSGGNMSKMEEGQYITEPVMTV